jgi:hypothetical protein
MMFVKPTVPNDPRYKALDRAMKKMGYEKSSLIESLHAAQEAFGFLDDELDGGDQQGIVGKCGEKLRREHGLHGWREQPGLGDVRGVHA